MAEKILLKDILFNKTKVEQIAKQIHRVYPSFKKREFVRDVLAGFPERELKARIGWIAETFKKYLPEDYQRAVNILIKALPLANNPDLADDDFGDFIYAPYAEYVARYGCSGDYLRTRWLFMLGLYAREPFHMLFTLSSNVENLLAPQKRVVRLHSCLHRS